MKYEISLLRASEASADDLQSIFRIYEKAFAASKFPISGKWQLDDFHGKGEREFYLLFKQGAEPQAFIYFTELDDLDWEIWNLSLAPDLWGQGFADLLLKNLQERLRSGQRILLEVHQNNKSAIELYLRNHWVITHCRKSYYQDGGDAVLMTFLKP